MAGGERGVAGDGRRQAEVREIGADERSEPQQDAEAGARGLLEERDEVGGVAIEGEAAVVVVGGPRHGGLDGVGAEAVEGGERGGERGGPVAEVVQRGGDHGEAPRGRAGGHAAAEWRKRAGGRKATVLRQRS